MSAHRAGLGGLSDAWINLRAMQEGRASLSMVLFGVAEGYLLLFCWVNSHCSKIPPGANRVVLTGSPGGAGKIGGVCRLNNRLDAIIIGGVGRIFCIE